MKWVDMVENSEFLQKLFPVPPSLTGIRILEVCLHQDGPRLTVRLNLNEYPNDPPPKWVGAAANRAQLTLMCIGVRDLELRGWSTNNLVDLRLEEVKGGVRLHADSNTFVLHGEFDAVRVDQIAAYQDSTRPPISRGAVK